MMEAAWTLEMSVEGTATAADDEARLVAASRDGDRSAFSELVRMHQHRVFRLSGRFFRNREDVEDAAQETFLTAWSKLHTYKARAPFEHWLTRICLNCCYGKLRRRRPAEPSLEIEPPAPSRDPDAALEVAGLLEKLQPADRFVLLLLDGEGWSVAEIAERLGWTRVNVKVRAHRARKKLRALLEQEAT